VVFAGKRVPQGRGSFGFGSRVRLPAVAGLPALVCLLDVVGLPAVAGPALPSSRHSERSEDRFLSERSLRGESLFLSLLDLGLIIARTAPASGRQLRSLEGRSFSSDIRAESTRGFSP